MKLALRRRSVRTLICGGASTCARVGGKRGHHVETTFLARGRIAIRPYDILCAVLACFAALTLTTHPVAGQEDNHPCLTVATPEPMPSPTPESTATPTKIPSPVASPEGATPVGFETPAVDPGAVISPEIAAVQEAIAACASEGDYAGMSTLVSTRYLEQAYSAGESLTRRAFINEIAPLLPVNPVRVVSVENVQQTANGATATVTLVAGNQLLQFDSTFVRQGDGDDRRWLLDSATGAAAPRPEGADIVHIRIEDGRYRLGEDTARSPEVVLKGTNEGDETHELLVVRLDGGTSTDALLVNPGPQFPRGITFAGQVTIAPGATDELVLVDLEPGRYAIVCLLYDQDGNPYLASGMSARLDVT